MGKAGTLKAWAEQKLQRMSKAFTDGDPEAFMKEFFLDVVSDYYLKRWFHGYAVKVEAPVRCSYQIMVEEPSSLSGVWMQVEISLEYKNYQQERFLVNLKVRQQEHTDELKITEVQIITIQPQCFVSKPLEREDALKIRKKLYVEGTVSGGYKLGQREPRQETDAVRKMSLYARAAAKSVRFRNTHPEIDCGAVWAVMMSGRMTRFAFLLKDYKIKDQIFLLHQYASLMFKVNTYDEYKEEGNPYYPARELSLLPLYSIDETLDYSRDHDVTQMNCVDFGSFYTGLLILCGIPPENIYIVVQPFHYLTVLEVEGQCFIISNNEIYPMNSRRLYGDTDIMRIVSPFFYLDSSIGGNIEETDYKQVRGLFDQTLKAFHFPAHSGGFREPWERIPFHTADYQTPEEYHTAVVSYVEEMDRKYPDSIFTWALYAYQSLHVDYPQAYLIWSLKSPEVKKREGQFTGLYDLLSWVKNEIGTGSVFEEPERIMTADQVIRSGKGSAKDRAVLIYTLASAGMEIEDGGIVITSSRSYVTLVKNRELLVLDAETLVFCEKPEGELEISFNNLICHRKDEIRITAEHPV